MKQLLPKQTKVIAFLIWIPVILFCTHLLIDVRNASVLSFLILSIFLYFILLVVGKVSVRLNKVNNSVIRMTKQFIYGFIFPLFLVITIVTLCDKFISDAVIQSDYLFKELMILSTYLYVANSFYLIIHLDRKFSVQMPLVEEGKRFHDKVVVYHNGAYAPINLMEIALIDQRSQINWLITFKEDEHILDLSLKVINDIIGAKQFFKINRSQIVHKDAISKFKSGSFGKIELILNVNNINATVSKDRAKEFRKWFYT